MVRNLAVLLLGSMVVTLGCSKATPDTAESSGDAPAVKVDELIAIVEADGDTAELAAGSLGSMGEDAAKAIPALSKSLESPNPRTRIAAAIALFDIDSKNEETMQKVVATIVRALTDDDDDVQREALRLLSRSQRATDEQVQAIAKALADNDDYVCAHAADALAKLGSRSVPVLIAATKDPKSILWAILAIEDIGPDAKSAQQTLAESTKDPDPLIRQESALALAVVQADPDVAVPALEALLDDPQAMVRAAAAHSLVRFGKSAAKATEKLRGMLTAEDPLSRIIAALALIALEQPTGDAAKPLVEVLIVGLDDEHPIARRESAIGLGKLGSSASAAKEKLESLAASDPDKSVQDAAGEAAKAVSK